MDFNQSWVKDVTWEHSFVDEVKGHISRSKVILGKVVRSVENVKVASFEKFKSDLNTFVITQTFYLQKVEASKLT